MRLKLSVLLLIFLLQLPVSIAPAQPAPAQSMNAPTVMPTQEEIQQQRDQQVEVPPVDPVEAVAKVQQAGLMGGYPDGQFHGEYSLTRAQLASILDKTFKLAERKATVAHPVTLRDVPSGYWAADAIHTVVSRGIMSGYRPGYFYPEQRVSRAEALSIFAQAYGVQQYDDQTVDTILSTYPDAFQIPAWARKSMATSLKNGFVNVPPSAKLYPLQPMTRQDMAYALGQYLERLSKTEQNNLQ